jgi:acetylornithine deacetylase/succinyl-diaminopimelate desuccinylase-like protein
LIRSTNREGVSVTTEIIGQRPAGEISENHPLVKLGLECLYEQRLTANLAVGSTDANIPLSQNIPALVLGVTTGGGAHTLNEFIDIDPIEKGMEALVRFVGEVGGSNEKIAGNFIELDLLQKHISSGDFSRFLLCCQTTDAKRSLRDYF